MRPIGGRKELISDPERRHLSKRPLFRRLAERLSGLLDRLQLPEDVVLVGTALVVGLATGGGAILFRYMIRAVDWIGYTWVPELTSGWGKAYVVWVPALGGLLVGLLVYFFAREAKGHGVPEVMEAVALKGGRIRPVVAVVKSLASSLCIGSGGSVGREGPIVQIGAALGSSTGQLLRLSDDRVRNLVACGAAGGIAATFNAPIAGVIFALEIILGEFSVGYFSNVVISAVAASALGQHVFGDVPAFKIPMEYSLRSTWELCLYPVLGVLAACTGAAFVRALYGAEDLFARCKRIPEMVQPAVGGALLGLLALSYPLVTGVTWDRRPQVFNVGYDVIDSALASDLVLTVVIALLVLKLAATCLTLGSGGSGGVFAPSLFMGAMLGTAFGLLAERLFPDIVAPPGAYALVGMGAVFAASAQAPISAVIILFELTEDYRIMLPLMLTVVVAAMLSRRFLRGESIYTLKLTRRGVRLQHGRDVDVLQGVKVSEVMRSDVATVSKDATLEEACSCFRQVRRRGLPVVDGGTLWGIVTLTDVEEAMNRGVSPSANVAEAFTPWEQLVLAHPDESLGTALVRLGPRGLGHMPVVAREDPRRYLGLIRREDILRGYQLALSRRAELEQRRKQIALGNLDGTEFLELTLADVDHAVGQKLEVIARRLPVSCVVVSVRRNGTVIIPRGSTVFQAGDRITIFVTRDASRDLARVFRDKASD